MTINVGKPIVKPLLARGLMKELDLLDKWNRLDLGRLSGKEFVDSMHQHEDIVNLEGRMDMAVDKVSNESEPGSENTEEYFPQDIVTSLEEDVPMFYEEEEEEPFPQESENRLVEDIPISNPREEDELFPQETDNPFGENVPLLCSDSTWRQLSFNGQYYLKNQKNRLSVINKFHSGLGPASGQGIR